MRMLPTAVRRSRGPDSPGHPESDCTSTNGDTRLEGEIAKRYLDRLEQLIYDSHSDWAAPNEKGRKATRPIATRYQQLVEPVLDLFQPGDIVMPALFLVQRWINKQIKDHVSPRLVYHTDLRKQVLRFVPESLLGALWLQFSQAIDADKEYRSCKQCGKWFEIALEGDGRTKRRLFCSDPCKSKDYRERRSRARQMRSEGKSIRTIVKELQTDGETIKEWLREC